MFRHPIAIQAIDIDHMGHVSTMPSTWIRMQDAVIDYWRSVARPTRSRRTCGSR